MPVSVSLPLTGSKAGLAAELTAQAGDMVGHGRQRRAGLLSVSYGLQGDGEGCPLSPFLFLSLFLSSLLFTSPLPFSFLLASPSTA